MVKRSKSRLLIVNHSLDLDDSILSHQASTVLELAEHFPKVLVLTGRIGRFETPANVRVISTRWVNSKRLESALRFQLCGLKALISFRPDVVFTHMADVQAALLAPIVRILGIRHVFWYAHAYKSSYLLFSSIFVNSLVSSTSGSMPIQSKKVHLIGQSIDSRLFNQAKFSVGSLKSYLHVGRIDRSKQIDLICRVFLGQFDELSTSNLTFIGSSVNQYSESYKKELLKKYKKKIESKTIQFLAPVPRNSLPVIYAQYDVFIHAFSGSLDKSLLEATAVGLPVVTLNSEYITEFGSWGAEGVENVQLENELSAFLNKTKSEVDLEITRRSNLVRQRHSQDSWISKLVTLLSV